MKIQQKKSTRDKNGKRTCLIRQKCIVQQLQWHPDGRMISEVTVHVRRKKGILIQRARVEVMEMGMLELWRWIWHKRSSRH